MGIKRMATKAAVVAAITAGSLGAAVPHASAAAPGYCHVAWGNSPKSGHSVSNSNVYCSSYTKNFSIWGRSTNGVIIETTKGGKHLEFCYRYWGDGHCERM